MQLKKILETKIISLDQEIQAMHLKSGELIKQIKNSQVDYLERIFTETTDFKNDEITNIENNYLNRIANAENDLFSLIKETNLETQPWSSRYWGNFILPNKKNPPDYIRIGELIINNWHENFPNMPAILQLMNNHILLFYSRQLADYGAKVISSILWRIIVSSSPDTFKFTLIDPIDHGSSFSSILELPEVLRGNKVFCQSREIEDVLQNVVKQIEEVKQRRLKEKYSTIEEYNAANSHTALPYQFIVFNAVPDGFTDHSISLLTSIAHSGIKAGFYLIGGFLNGEKRIVTPNLDRILENSTCILLNNDGYANWDDSLFAHFPVKLDSPPTKSLTELISSLVTESIVNESNIIEFAQYAPEISEMMKSSSELGISATIGIDQNGDPYSIELGPRSDSFNVLVGGRIHSGKTNFLHNLILSLCLKYSHEEIQLYLVDFKEGVEFQDYAHYKLPHAKAIVIESEREYGLSILNFLVKEMENRSILFKPDGVNVVNFEQYREISKKALPRIIVIFDEFVKLFEEDDQISDMAYKRMLELALRGRGFGIHLILSSQRPIGNVGINAIKNQINIRIAFKCNDPDDSSLLLGERNEKAALLERNGLAYVTNDPSIPEKSNLVKIGYVTRDDRELYLKYIQKSVQTSFQGYKWQAVVFSKSEPIFLKDCYQMNQIITNTISLPEPIVWLGKPIRLADDCFITIKNQENENILLLGANENAIFQSLVHQILSIAITSKPNKAEFVWLSVPNSSQDASEYLDELKFFLPNDFVIINLIDELIERLNARLSSQNKNKSKIFIVIPGIHRINEFRKKDFDGFDDIPISEKFEKLVQDGPQVGIHFIIWSDRSKTIRNIFANNQFDCFNHRLLFHVEIDDSNDVIGVPDASKLGLENRFIYRCREWSESVVEKIKPYDLPNVREFHNFVQMILDKRE